MTESVPSVTALPLLAALGRTGPHPVLAWYGEAARIELSGHVLANWVIKAVGHLHDEVMLEPGDEVLIDLPAHWKRLVLALAAWSLGAELSLADRDGGIDDTSAPAAPRVLVTDRPDSQIAETAEDVLAVQPVSLTPGFAGDLPPLVRDWVQEVRSSPDQLGVPLPRWSGPAALTAVTEVPDAQAPRLLVADDGLGCIDEVIAVFLAGGGIVGPSAAVTARQAADEGITARA